jgi:hypothetical protein
MTHPIHVYPNQVLSLDETIWANADEFTVDWETYATAASTNTYVAVNSAGTSDWVWLHSWRYIQPEDDTTRTLRYDMQSPSGEVNPYQNVDLTVRCRRYDAGVAPSSATVTINLFENNSQVTGGGGAAQQVNNTAASYYTHRLSTTAINNVSNWANVEIDAEFAATAATSPPEQYVTFRVYEVKIVFS